MRPGDTPSLTRRRLLMLGAGLGFWWLCDGCGGGAKKGGEDGASTRKIPVAAPVGLFPEGALVRTGTASPVPLNADSKAEVTVSSRGVQLVAITDGDTRLLGLALVLPEDTSVTLDTASTVLALTLLTPGLSALDPSTVAATRAEQSSGGTLTTLGAYLAGRISTDSLGALRTDPQWNQLLGDAVDRERGKARQQIVPLDAEFDVRFSGSGDDIAVANYGWREVAVLRERRTVDQNSLLGDLPTPFPLGGATGIPFISNGSAGRTSDYPDLGTDPPVGLVRYTVYGPGRANDNLPLPERLAGADPWGTSFVYALALPLVDLALGESLTLRQGWEGARALWSELGSAATEAALPVRQAIRTGDVTQSCATLPAITDLLFAAADRIVVRYGLATAVLATDQVSIPPSTGPTATELTTLLRLLGSAFAPAHFVLASDVWVQYPEVSVFDLPVTTGEVIVK